MIHQDTVRIAFRFVAVLTVFVGAIRSTRAVVGFLSILEFAGGHRASLNQVGGSAVGIELLIVVWGATLWFSSDWLAEKVAR